MAVQDLPPSWISLTKIKSVRSLEESGGIMIALHLLYQFCKFYQFYKFYKLYYLINYIFQFRKISHRQEGRIQHGHSFNTAYLLDGYTDRRTQAQWQLELHSCKQNANEGVISFANRVENCYIKLLGTLDDTLDDERRNIHTEMLQTQALNVFLMGLNREVAMIVKARNPNTLEDAIRLALSEEQELKSRLEITRYQNVGNSNSRFCTNCNRNGHTSFNCRSQNQSRKNFSQPQSFTNNQFQKQNIRQIGNNAYVNKKFATTAKCWSFNP
ncbi:hypothetical protein HHI36_016037 [Cryptolaemus montrouzieri]|uniref:CCHC-type domain-containing protein n=1 Tax=Cryptolaemus montrouzieri TaxID=559131 RepID=A0ABD2N7V3_9CUCU